MRNDSNMTRYGRRTISIGAYASLWVCIVVFFPVLLVVVGASDLVRRRPFAGLRLLLFTLFFLSMELAGVTVAGFLWLRHAIGMSGGPAAYTEQHFRLQCWWASRLANTGMRIFGMRLEVQDDYPFSDRPILLFVRHASFADTVIAALLVGARHGIRLRYVMKRELLWDPCLDIVGHRLQNHFVSRVDASQEEIDAVGRLAEDLGEREGVLIYPEGTRFTPEKRERILEKLRGRGEVEDFARASALQHVLPPRLGGTLALLERNATADAVFCAHTGLEGTARLSDVLKGATVGKTVRVAFWGVDADRIPRERSDQIAWFHDQWTEVDRHCEP